MGRPSPSCTARTSRVDEATGKILTHDEARGIAAKMAKLPGLLRAEPKPDANSLVHRRRTHGNKDPRETGRKGWNKSIFALRGQGSPIPALSWRLWRTGPVSRRGRHFKRKDLWPCCTLR